MSFSQSVKLVLGHPLNRKSGRINAIRRVLAWQLASRIMRTSIALPFVNDSFLVTTTGMTGATGNWYCGLHEVSEMGFSLHLLRSGDLFIDVGANIGSYTVLAAAGPGASVISVEPIPTTFATLKRNIAFNSLETLVQCVERGLSDREGYIDFTTGSDSRNHVIHEGEKNLEHSRICVVTLDKLCGDRRPKLLKIDVEGHEKAVLQGATRTLSDPHLSAVIMETNGLGLRVGVDDGELISIMASYGFRPFQYDPFSRELEEATDDLNTIFIRNPEEILAVCKAAPIHRLCNGTI